MLSFFTRRKAEAERQRLLQEQQLANPLNAMAALKENYNKHIEKSLLPEVIKILNKSVQTAYDKERLTTIKSLVKQKNFAVAAKKATELLSAIPADVVARHDRNNTVQSFKAVLAIIDSVDKFQQPRSTVVSQNEYDKFYDNLAKQKNVVLGNKPTREGNRLWQWTERLFQINIKKTVGPVVESLKHRLKTKDPKSEEEIDLIQAAIAVLEQKPFDKEKVSKVYAGIEFECERNAELAATRADKLSEDYEEGLEDAKSFALSSKTKDVFSFMKLLTDPKIVAETRASFTSSGPTTAATQTIPEIVNDLLKGFEDQLKTNAKNKFYDQDFIKTVVHLLKEFQKRPDIEKLGKEWKKLNKYLEKNQTGFQSKTTEEKKVEKFPAKQFDQRTKDLFAKIETDIIKNPKAKSLKQSEKKSSISLSWRNRA